MPTDRDALLLESVSTHRARLASAFVFGELSDRRKVNDNLRRFIGGVVVAAVVCAICIATSFIGSILADQEAERIRQEQQSMPLPGNGEADG